MSNQPPNPIPTPEAEAPALPPIEFKAAGSTEEVSMANLESVLPSPGYPPCAFVLADALTKRTEQIVLDFSTEAVVVRFKIDGMWHQMPSVDRQTGDYMMATLKKLADLNYRERRARQESKFETKFAKRTYVTLIKTQGTQSGERAALTFREKDADDHTPEQLGMRPKMKETLVSLMNESKGLVAITSLPGDGLSTSWHSMLNASDRFMRDVVALEEASRTDTDVINIRSVTYDERKNETPLTGLPKVLLREPDVLVFPEIPNGRVLDRYCDLALEDEKMVFTRLNAKHAVDGLFRMMALKPTLDKLSQTLSCVLYHRLVRRLCDTCKMAFAPSPQMLQQLNIPVGRVSTMYTHFQPRPEDLVNEKGEPVEIPPCTECGGLGYVGRIGIFELLVINDEMRQAMAKKPKMDHISQLAKKSGHISLRDEGIVLVAQGITSIEELQRVLSK